MAVSPSAAVERVRSACEGLDWITAPIQLKRLSKDFHWFSPVLKQRLESCRADAVVKPRSEAELAQLVAACVRERVAITLRGGGTGNYGQAVPLEGGVVVEMTALTQLELPHQGVVTAQAGIRLAALESSLRPTGWELRCMPSTFRMATLGGLFCGGFGGIGSITYGPLAAPGTVLGARVMTVEEQPRILELDAEEALSIGHAYGTNAIVLALTLALAPRIDWRERLLGFPDQRSAFDFAARVAAMPGVIKRQLAYFEPKVAAHFDAQATRLAADEHAVVLVAAAQSDTTIARLVNEYRGREALVQEDASEGQGDTLLEYCWNHTTLHALKHDKSLTYLQTSFPPGRELELIEMLRARLGDELNQHLEFIRDLTGQVICAGLPLLHYRDQARLEQVIALHRELGVQVNDPHTPLLEEGKHAGHFDPKMLAAKQRNDPFGLLNPGKMRSFTAA